MMAERCPVSTFQISSSKTAYLIYLSYNFSDTYLKFNITITHLIAMNCKKGLWSVHHEPASILPDSDDVSGLGRQSEIKFSINNVHAAFTALEGPTCTALIKMTG